MEAGATVETSGPYGHFVYTETQTPAVFIAGGIGVTPFRSIIGDLASRKVRSTITLLYSNRTTDIPLRSFFDALLPAWLELQLVYTVTQPPDDWKEASGRIDAVFIKQHVPDLTRPLFFVSGPTPPVEAMRNTLSELDVDSSHVKHEAFPGYDR